MSQAIFVDIFLQKCKSKDMDKNADPVSSQQSGLLTGQSETFKFVIDSLSVGVAIGDLTGKLVYFNPAAEKILGIGLMLSSQEEWQKIYGVFHEDMTTPVQDDDHPLVKGLKGETVTGVIRYVKNAKLKDGIFTSTSGSPIRNNQGQIIGSLALFSDVTKERDTTKHFQEKVEVEAKMNALFIDREEAMKELKKENEELKEKLKSLPAS